MSLTNFFIGITQIGAEWVMWVLVGLSVISVAVMLERAIFFLARRVKFESFASRLETLLKAGDLTEAARLAKSSRAPECVVAAAGVAQFKRSSEAISEAMQSAKARERTRFEAYLTVLATLGNNAPFVGLLGTVLGIIKASSDLAAAQAAKEAAAGAVMAGVFEALVATAVGLFVAIPAVVAYNFFQRAVRKRMGQADSIAHMILAIHAHAKASRPASAASEPVNQPVGAS
jgi:biopolymer transport protein ExbB